MGMLTVTAEEQPLIKELWQYFYDTYLNPSEYYENLNLYSGDVVRIRIIIFGICIGLIFAAFGAVFNKRVLGDIVRKILKAEAFSPEGALTLDELGLVKKPVARLAVRKSTSLRRVVKCREEQEFEADLRKKKEEYAEAHEKCRKKPKFKEISYKMNVYADTYYIPEDMKYMADVKFEKKGTTWLGACIFALVMTVVFVALMVALPSIFTLLDDFVGSIGGGTSKNIL